MPVLGRPVDVEGFWRDGYAIVRNVYSPDEIQAFRDACHAGGGAEGGDLLHKPALRSVLTDGSLVEIARKVLGEQEIWYAGDSSFTINSNSHGWHKDNADRDDPKAPDWQSPYTQLRFGIYLQDHTKGTGGLNLRSGSHEWRDASETPNTYVKSGIGDVGVWSMRITHSGNGTLLRFPPGKTVDPNDKRPVAKWKIAKSKGDRMAVFAALGLDDAHGRRYTEYLKTRTYQVDAWRKAGAYTEDALSEARAIGLNVRDVPSEVMNDPNAGLSAGWAPIPY